MRETTPQVFLIARPAVDLDGMRRYLEDVGGESWLQRRLPKIFRLNCRLDRHQPSAEAVDEAREALRELDERYRGRESWASGRVAAGLYQWAKRVQEVRLAAVGSEHADTWLIEAQDVRSGVEAYLAGDAFPNREPKATTTPPFQMQP